jgi:hypothetical protein|tara:strand:- start:6149 stop:6568 length:420 start_codon:yes stop_codon:yes gene_type:complete
MSETNFWHLLRSKLPFKMYRIENKVAIGTPDVHFLYKGKTGWLELKYVYSWPIKKFYSGLKKHQAIWLKDYSANGGKCWVVIRVAKDGLIVFNGKNVDKLIDCAPLKDIWETADFKHKGVMKNENWQQLQKVFTDSTVV